MDEVHPSRTSSINQILEPQASKDPILEGSYTLCYCAGSDSGRHPDMGLLAAVSILMIAVCSVIWKYIINMQLNCRNDWDLGDVLNVVYKDICRLSMKSEHSLYTLFTCCSPPGQQSCAATWILPFNLPALPLPSAVHVVTSIFLLRPKKPTFFF